MKKLTVIVFTVLVSVMSAYAQHNLRSAYFLDGYTYKHKLNPAFGGERGYFAIPALGHLSLGVESKCELLDFELEGETVACQEIKDRLNRNLTEGVRILEVYENGAKLKHLAYLSCEVTLEYDQGIPTGAAERIRDLFQLPELIVEKKGKNGLTEQNIVPMIRELKVAEINPNELCLTALICCQNPTLNPALLIAAISKYVPELSPDFSRICRTEIYNLNNEIFR